VTASRSSHAPKSTSPAPGLARENAVQRWLRFWFTPQDPVALHVVRVAAGLLFLAWLLPFAGRLDSFFGLAGWLDRQAYTDLARLPEDMAPQFGWSAVYLTGTNPTALAALYWASVAAIVLFTLGVATRVTSVLTWVAVASFTTNPVFEYDADVLLAILSFYLMIGYVFLGQRDTLQPLASRLIGSWNTLLLGRRSAASAPVPSVAANVALRLLQVHFAIVMVTSGLHKLQFGDWWAGYAFWYPLHPAGVTTVAQVQALGPIREAYLAVISLAAYLTLAWQLTFPLFAWRPRWRPVLIGGAVLGWLGIALVYHMPLFGPAIFISCLSYVTPAEWHPIFGRVARLPGLDRLASWLPADDAARSAARKDEAASLVPVG
jgi:hypothetical protein